MSEPPSRPLPLRAYLAVLASLGAAAAVIALAWLSHDAVRLAGTNSISPQGVAVGAVRAGKRVCVRDLRVPAGADAVRLRLQAAPPGPAPVKLVLSGAGLRRSASATVPPGDFRYVDFRVGRIPREQAATVCLFPGAPLGGVAGSPLLQSSGRPQAFVDGRPQPNRVAVLFLAPDRPSLASELPEAVRRAALFRPGWVGVWTYPLLLALLAGAWLLGLRALVREGRR